MAAAGDLEAATLGGHLSYPALLGSLGSQCQGSAAERYIGGFAERSLVAEAVLGILAAGGTAADNQAVEQACHTEQGLLHTAPAVRPGLDLRGGFVDCWGLHSDEAVVVHLHWGKL